jgi:hypothetical protein
MTQSTECIAYRRESGICANGFIQTFPCWGDTRCNQCGRPSEKLVPHCMKDELPERWLNDDGSPRFYVSPAALHPTQQPPHARDGQ